MPLEVLQPRKIRRKYLTKSAAVRYAKKVLNMKGTKIERLY
jgi:hypothetical protein